MAARAKYIGWVVLWCDGPADVGHRFYRAHDEEDARDVVRRMNAATAPSRLYWCEWWSTSSTVGDGAPAQPGASTCCEVT